MKEVAANPEDSHLIPYQDDCQRCDGLKSDPQPGLHTWCMMLARHMQDDHKIVLAYR